MKEMIVAIMLVLISVVSNNVGSDVKIQVVEFDIMNDSEKIVKEINGRVGDTVNLEKFRGNNVEILEVNDENVKISREALRYEILNQTSIFNGETRKYYETVTETVEFNRLIPINIDSNNPFGPELGQARYHYKMKFVK